MSTEVRLMRASWKVSLLKMLLKAVWVLFLADLSLGLAEKHRADAGGVICKITPTDKNQQTALSNLLNNCGCEVPNFPANPGMALDAICPGDTAKDLMNKLKTANIKYTTSTPLKAEDQEEEEEEEEEEERFFGPEESALNKHIRFSKYNRYDKIQLYLARLSRDYPEFVEMKFASIKQSHEGRNLTYLKIGTSPQGARTKSVWIDAGIHAREWSSTGVALYTIDKLARVFLKQKEGETLTSQEEDIVGVNWLVMPLLNPDGYEYSHTGKEWSIRLWRKNRSPVGNDCFGVDLNRNFDVVGYGTGFENAVSKDPCNPNFIGSSKASELEVQMASEVVMANKDTIRVSVSLHCYGGYILTPWAYQKPVPKDHDRMVAFGQRLNKAMQKIEPRRNYTVGACGDIFFYTAGGSTLDYFKATSGIPFVVTIELPDEGYYFWYPSAKIQHLSKEVWESMYEVAKTARDEPLSRIRDV